jgi:transcriptional regulator with XRE-family HTH domain
MDNEISALQPGVEATELVRSLRGVMSASEIAERCNVHFSTVHKFHRGETTWVTSKVLRRLRKLHTAQKDNLDKPLKYVAQAGRVKSNVPTTDVVRIKLRKLLKVAGWNFAYIAKRVGLKSGSTVAGWFQGNRPNPDSWKKLVTLAGQKHNARPSGRTGGPHVDVDKRPVGKNGRKATKAQRERATMLQKARRARLRGGKPATNVAERMQRMRDAKTAKAKSRKISRQWASKVVDQMNRKPCPYCRGNGTLDHEEARAMAHIKDLGTAKLQELLKR